MSTETTSQSGFQEKTEADQGLIKLADAILSEMQRLDVPSVKPGIFRPSEFVQRIDKYCVDSSQYRELQWEHHVGKVGEEEMSRILLVEGKAPRRVVEFLTKRFYQPSLTRVFAEFTGNDTENEMFQQDQQRYRSELAQLAGVTETFITPETTAQAIGLLFDRFDPSSSSD